MSTTERFEFQTQARELMELMVYSVYSNKDIFLREAISNASDALDKLRFEALSDKNLEPLTGDLHIRLETDQSERSLSIIDNGIGMNREDLKSFLGTIARSGTKEFISMMKEASRSGLPEDLIGQFGVGFYSCFMVAKRIQVTSKKAGEDQAWLWESTGDGSFTIEETRRAESGTTVKLYLKDADQESGLQDYASDWVLRGIVKKYSDFVSYPIKMKTERREMERDEEGNPKEDGKETIIVEDEVINSMKAIWTRPEKDVTDEEYAEFYKHISHDWTDPMKRIVSKAEGSTEFRMLLFLPGKKPFDLFHQDAKHGVDLYIKRVFIMSDCKELLPNYFRFIKGVVDSEDLPLNISREMIHKDRNIKTIRKTLVRKLMATLAEMRDKERTEYEKFWANFGQVIKEGLVTDHDQQEKLLEVTLFESTNGTELVTLEEYISRMKEGQDKIYYLTGKSRKAIEDSPHIEAFKARGYEVLLLSDPVDEVWVQSVYDYKEKGFASIGKGAVDLPEEKKQEGAEGAEEKETKEDKPEDQQLISMLKTSLDEYVKEVRFSTRLTTSPSCLVGDVYDMSPNLVAMMKAAGQDVPAQKRILELNPTHPITDRLKHLTATEESKALFDEYAYLLYGQAVLAEGGTLPDPAGFSRKLADMMVRSI